MAITEFDVPEAYDTLPAIININGVITGSWVGVGGSQHGFIRYSDGTILSFDVPDVTDTVPTWINDSGVVVGYVDFRVG
jgi:hypothetical protein